MTRYTLRRLVVCCACLASFAPRSAAAQLPDRPVRLAGGRVTFGADFTAVAGRRDTDAFFNYTDYEHDALRLARLRLLAEWRISARLALLGEVRTENAGRPDVAALYLRWRPWAGRDFDVQAGRIPPVILAFARRAYGRDNLVIGVPLAYQYLTSLRPDALPATIDDLLRMRARGWQPSFPIGASTLAPGVPLVSAFRWDTGIEAHVRRRWLDLAGAVTRGAPAAPVVRETNDGRQWSGRAAVHTNSGWTVGLSAARGMWIDAQVLVLVPEADRVASRQSVIGADLEVGRMRWVVRAEWLRSVFDLPIRFATPPSTVLTAWSGFVEGRYRISPRWQISSRVDRLDFGRTPGVLTGAGTRWDARVDRVEGVVGFRALPNLELRAGWQHNWRDGGRVRVRSFPAGQVLYWF